MTTPANHEVRVDFRHQYPRVAQDVKDDIADAFAGAGIEDLVRRNFVFDIGNITQHGEQLFLDAGYDFAVNECALRRIFDFEFYAAFLLHHSNLKVLVLT